MALTLITPPLKEPISIGEARAFLKVTSDKDNLLLQQLIKTARTAVEAFTARALLLQTWRFTVNAGFCAAKSDSNFLVGNNSRGTAGLELPRSPFVELLECPKLIDPYGTHELKDYRLDTAGRIARMHFGKSLTLHLNGASTVQIDFAAGYGEAPEDIPEPLRHAVLLMLTELYDNRVSSNDNEKLPPTLSDAALQLIKPYRVQRIG